MSKPVNQSDPKSGSPRPSRFRKLWRICRRLLGSLFAVWLVSLAWEFRQLSKDADGYLRRRYGNGLAWVTSVEVVSLGPGVTDVLATHFSDRKRYQRWLWSKDSYFMHQRRTVRGKAAEKVAALWRKQDFLDGMAGCHEPGYVLRFYCGPWKRAEITLCWSCFNASVPALWSESLLSFDAHGTNGLALLEELKGIAPLPTEADFNYTNAALSEAELEARLVGAFKSGWNWELTEWVNHSPQKAEFLSRVVTRLDSHSSRDVERAIWIIAGVDLTNQIPRLTDLLSHTNHTISGAALASLERFNVSLDPAPLLPLLTSPVQSHRRRALQLLARRTSVNPALVLPEVERSLAGYGRDAFDRYTRDALSRQTNRLPAWIPVVERLREGARPAKPSPPSGSR